MGDGNLGDGNAVLLGSLISVFVSSYRVDEANVHFVAGHIEVGNQPLGVIGKAPPPPPVVTKG